MKVLDSHIHLFAKINAHGLPDDHPLNKDCSLDALVDTVEHIPQHEVEGFVIIEADPLTGLKAKAKGGTEEGQQVAYYEYLAWLRAVHNKQLPLEGVSAKGKQLLQGLVPWVPLDQGPEVTEKFIQHLESISIDSQYDPKLIKGVRYLFQDKPTGVQLQPNIADSLNLVIGPRGLVFDVGIDMHSAGLWQLDEFTQLLKKTHGVKYVINHLAKPNYPLQKGVDDADGVVKTPEFIKWADYLTVMANDKHNETYMKLSGAFDELPVEVSVDSKAAVEYILPWAKAAYDIWGPDRLLFGSNWPVVTAKDPRNTYVRWTEIVDTLLERLEIDEKSKQKIWYDNTKKVYDL